MRALGFGAGLVLWLALLIPAPAMAEKEHQFLGMFCEPSGLETAPCEPSFDEAQGLAFDQQSGDLLVIDRPAGTLSRFHADGTPDEFEALGSNVISGFGFSTFADPGEVQVAVDESGGATKGNIYVTEPETKVVSIFSSRGELLGQLTQSSEGSLNEPCGVAVDPSGDVYVGDFSGHIYKYEPSGNPVVNTDNVANFAYPEDCALVAGVGPSTGFIFPIKFHSKVAKLDIAAGEEKYVVDPGPTTTDTINSASGRLLTASGKEVKEFDVSGGGAAEKLSSFSLPSEAMGIAVDAASGDVYVSRVGSSQIEVFGPAVTVPKPMTKEATEIGTSAAILNGTVNPEGKSLTECFFEWGGTKSYGKTVPCESPDAAEVGEGEAPVAVQAHISNLSAGTVYHFRLVAANSNLPAGVKGEDEPFQTLGPAISEEGVVGITDTEAKLSALIDPKGEETSYAAQYVTEAQFKLTQFAEATLVPEPKAMIPAVVTGSGDLSTATGTGNLAKGFTQVQSAHATSGSFAVGQTIFGTGIPAGTTIVAVNGETLTLSNAVSASSAGVTLSANSTLITNVATTAGHFTPGQSITGAGIPPETTILSVGTGKLTLSKPPTETIKEAALSATGPQATSQQLAGLEPGTPYRFRFIATNGSGTAEGESKGFSTFTPPEIILPDNRAYEMVSPPQKAGEVIPPEPTGELSGSCENCLPGANSETMPVQTALNGDSVLYYGQPFSEGLAAAPNEYVAAHGPGEWASQSLSPPEITGRYEAFTTDLSNAVLYQVTPTLSPEAPTRGGKGFANLYLRSEGGGFTPLVTEEPPERDPGVPTQFSNIFEVVYAGANSSTALDPPFTHMVFEANDALTEAVAGVAPAAPEVSKGGEECGFAEAECNLYEWEGGQLSLVNVLPNGEAGGRATIGSARLLAENPPYEGPNVDHAISTDGSKVFWSSEETGQVYVRVDGEETFELPGPATCKKSTPRKDRTCFLTASADGSKVLLSDGTIYELNGTGSAFVKGPDLTEGQEGFQGILGPAEDLSRIYFVDTKSLTGENAEHRSPNEGGGEENNLYLWEEGTTRFVGTLLGADDQFGLQGRYGDWKAARPDRTAQTSLDGTFAAFMSRAPLTQYDNAGKFEVFEYSAISQKLVCASCNPSEQPPLGRSNLSLINPGQPAGGAFPPYPQPGNLSREGNGRLFFESQDALTPTDTNGHIQDVYEWEPNGIGSCERASGCVFLISSGQSPNDSMFLDSTPSGNDAFFISRQRLAPRDMDSQLDLYDARVGGGFQEGGASPCLGEACKGSVSASPPIPSPNSGEFNGPGNPPRPKPKKKHHHHKHKHHKKRITQHRREDSQ